MDNEQPYRVVFETDEFRVTDRGGRIIMTCKDNRSAEHYAALLTQAFQRGYRTGYRDGKSRRE